MYSLSGGRRLAPWRASSDPTARKGQVTLGEIESTGNRRNSLSCRKAAAFQGWHEPDESRDSRPAL
jgi:hypothetical protein